MECWTASEAVLWDLLEFLLTPIILSGVSPGNFGCLSGGDSPLPLWALNSNFCFSSFMIFARALLIFPDSYAWLPSCVLFLCGIISLQVLPASIALNSKFWLLSLGKLPIALLGSDVGSLFQLSCFQLKKKKKSPNVSSGKVLQNIMFTSMYCFSPPWNSSLSGSISFGISLMPSNKCFCVFV